MSSAFEGLPKTPNLSLNKPGYDNVADIEALNENADILDEEINKLKTNLKNKGSATEPLYFDSNGVPQKTKNFNNYLPLSGGLMTDTVIGRSVNDSLLDLIGGTNGDNGAALMLYGKSNSSGRFLIRANNGTAKIDLIGTADGGLKWDNKDIFHSGKTIPIVNGGTGANNSADALRNLKAIGNRGAINVDNEYGSFWFNNGDNITGFTPPNIDGDYNVLQIGALTDYCRDRVQLYFNGHYMYSRSNDSDGAGVEGWSNWLLHEKIVAQNNNNNEGYIKYASGLQICYGLKHYVASDGSFTINYALPFPSEFGDPVLNVTYYDENSGSYLNSWNSNNFASNCKNNPYIMYIAIGRWN